MYSRLCNTSSLRLTTPHDEGRTDAMTSSPAQQREGAGPEVPFSPPSNQPLLSTPAEPLCHYFSIPQIPGTPPNKLIEPDMLLGDAQVGEGKVMFKTLRFETDDDYCNPQSTNSLGDLTW
ncbi:Hypothetical protein, putative [Bodo saltans]|uniref:Uncharacterized protein n=1 Tax=Bodo saltans TaxID=75058 RepID=A0A0S4KEA7_BODSA|nr:Hypothetical protein, putative [Bodo saltans]|eukprot:CUI13270.1 Hypothetical protein, putative [Bodo saltans]